MIHRKTRQASQDAPGSSHGSGVSTSASTPDRAARGRPRLGPDDKAATETEVRAIVQHLAKRAAAERRRGIDHGPRARDLLIVELACGTGLRVSELARLEVRDIVLARRKSYVRVRGGKARPRRHVDTVPLPWDLIAGLERWCDPNLITGSPHSPLFTAATSSRPLIRQEVSRIVKRAVRACGLRDVLCAHSLRHFYGTRVALATRSSAMVQRLMRLRSPRLADHYTHVALEEATAAVGPLRTPGRRAKRLPLARAR